MTAQNPRTPQRIAPGRTSQVRKAWEAGERIKVKRERLAGAPAWCKPRWQVTVPGLVGYWRFSTFEGAIDFVRRQLKVLA